MGLKVAQSLAINKAKQAQTLPDQLGATQTSGECKVRAGGNSQEMLRLIIRGQVGLPG